MPKGACDTARMRTALFCERGRLLASVTILAAVSLLTAACGSAKHPSQEAQGGEAGGDSSSTRRICDGSAGIRLAFTMHLGGGSLQPFTSSLYDLGLYFLYVDGTCHYWIQDPSLAPNHLTEWRPYGEGQLSAEQEERLHDTVGYDHPEQAPAGIECTPSSTVDASAPVYWDGDRVHSCPGGSLNLPDYWPLRDQLFDGSSPVNGAMRVQIGIDAVVDDARVYEWPIETPLEQLTVEATGSASTRIDDDADVAALRALRDRALADDGNEPGRWGGNIVVEPAGFVREVADETYVMSLRDDLPFTDSNGRWTP
ncbi:MAG TPA: hypothetical protein VER04_23195 [Polyangiaceae bacterium]|nr:hypothetical protein [Polyangiaceae bacterium]